MKILIISKCPTHPTTAGNRWGVLAQANFLRQLGNTVHFLYVNEMPLRSNKKPYLDDLQETGKYWGKEFYIYNVNPLDKIRQVLMQKVRYYLFNGYYKLNDKYPLGLTSYVEKIHKRNKYDICIVNYVYLTKLFEKVKFMKSAVFTHDCLAYRNLTVGSKVESLTASEEAKGVQRCTDIFAVQDIEEHYFRILSPKSRVFNIYSKYSYHSDNITGNKNILFLSGGNPFNINGLNWFITKVLPVIIKRFPDAKLIVGGSICKAIPRCNNNASIVLAGYVDDPAAFYALGDIAINPVFQGTGLKIKTFESISYDKVTLVHPHSMIGIYKSSEAPIFASDEPMDWVHYLEKVWGDELYIKRIKQSNSEYIKEMQEYVENQYKKFLAQKSQQLG